MTGSPSIQDVKACWLELITTMRSHDRELQALLRAGEPVATEKNTVFIRFRYEFHAKRVSEDSMRRTTEQVLGLLLGQLVQVCCLLPDEQIPDSAVAEPAPTEEELSARMTALLSRYRIEKEELEDQLPAVRGKVADEQVRSRELGFDMFEEGDTLEFYREKALAS